MLIIYFHVCVFQFRNTSDLLRHNITCTPGWSFISTICFLEIRNACVKKGLTSETECVQDKLRAVENGEAAVLVSFVLAIFEAVKVFGVSPRTDLSNLVEVHWNTTQHTFVKGICWLRLSEKRIKPWPLLFMAASQFHTFAACAKMCDCKAPSP